jgi:hypothetical protein
VPQKIIKIKCPKCGAAPKMLTEEWTGSGIQREVINGMLDDVGEKFYGRPCGVNARCSNCDHGWRLRGVTQITEVYVPGVGA